MEKHVGDQVPVYQIEDADGWHDCEKDEFYSLIKSQSIPDVFYRILYTAPQKPVVLPALDEFYETSNRCVLRRNIIEAIEAAGGTVKEDE